MSDPPRRWFRFRLRTLLLLTFLAVVGLSINSYWNDYVEQTTRRERELLAPAKGAWCTVELHGSAPADENATSGRFYLMNDEWLVLETREGAQQQWIPRAQVKKLVVDVR